MARSAAPAPVAVHSGGGAVVAHSAAIRGSVMSGGTHTTVRQGAVRSGAVTRVRTVNGVVHITRRSSTPVRRVRHINHDFLEDDTDAVPGLGFDFVHFAATHPNAFKGHHRATVGGFIPFFSGGFVMPSVPVVVDEETADEGEETVVDEAPRHRVHVLMQEAAPAPTAAVEPGPMVPSEEFVFVRRDGTVFFAVAYSWENGALRYITNQGLRGTLTREALDLGATQQFNEQRGLNFRAPA